MPAGKHREIHIGTLRSPAEINRAIDEGRQAPAVRLTLPPAPRGVSVVGIDPGKRGGLAYFAPGGVLEELMVMPLRGNGSVDTRKVREFIERRRPSRIVLELVHAMPHDGRSRLWTFASGVGALESALAETEVPVTKVDPQRWQNAMLVGLPRGESTKDSARRRCSELWGAERFVLPRGRVPHDGLCDAALLGAYGLFFDGVRLR